MKRIKTFTAAVITALAVLIPLKCYSAPKVSDQRQQLIDFALTLRGTPYVYGGKTPEKGFDCSGFVSYATSYGVNVVLPPSSRGIYTNSNVTIINEADREPGDLVFFKTTSSGEISHVGIYLGIYNGEGSLKGKRLFIHCASDGPETGVIVSPLDSGYWKEHLAGWARILPETEQ